MPRDCSTLTSPFLWLMFRRCHISELGTKVKETDRIARSLCVAAPEKAAGSSSVKSLEKTRDRRE